jgi:hypothetical protein
VTLDGLCGALLYAWPGPIYEGNGECQAIIDERADGKQRDALATVLYGGETNEGATHWWVYRMMSSTVHSPIFKRIEFEIAEIGSGTTKTTASIALDLMDTYCHFTVLRQSGKGVVRSR